MERSVKRLKEERSKNSGRKQKRKEGRTDKGRKKGS